MGLVVQLVRMPVPRTREGRNSFQEFISGLVVQLVRMPACHAGGREFESRPDRLKMKQLH